MNRHAQMWITDFIVGFLIFSIGIVLASRFIFTAMNDSEFSEVQAEGHAMTDYLLSSGIPANWTNETVVRIGLTTNNRLNSSKISEFYNMSYETTRIYLSSSYNYLVFFQKNNTILNFTRCSYGAFNISGCEINISTLDFDNLVKTTRLVVYNGSIIEMVLYLWE